MRGSIPEQAVLARRFRGLLERCRAHPLAYPAARCCGCFLLSYVLTACSLGNTPQPFAAAFLAVVEFGFPSTFSVLGCCIGYLRFWGIDLALEMLAVSILVFAATGIFHGTPAVETPAFGSVMAAMMTAVVGIVFLLDGTQAAFTVPGYFLRVLLAALCPLAFHAAVFCRARYARLFLAGCALYGAAQMLLPRGMGLSLLLAFSLIAAILPSKMQTQPIAAQTLSIRTVQKRLERAAQTLGAIYGGLRAVPQPRSDADAAQIFDHAADKVCRCCVQYADCWTEQGQATYRVLCEAAASFLERGSAKSEDFAPEFAEHCRHFDGFVTAVNQELDTLLYRRQYRNRAQEQQRLLISQYQNIAQYLKDEAACIGAGQEEPVFRPRVGVTASPKGGNPRSGDRGACFFGQDHAHYYVLLCDGMGTGDEAADTAGQAIAALSALLQAGMAPELALKTLNEAYILSGSGVFSTVDLAQIDLCTGMATLYKWGAAPSYRKRRHAAEKIGTATVPPGVGVGGDHRAERYRLSLQRGEMLILLSDGADDEETENRIAGYTGSSEKELSAYLVAGTLGKDEDDKTAIVISLQAVSSE